MPTMCIRKHILIKLRPAHAHVYHETTSFTLIVVVYRSKSLFNELNTLNLTVLLRIPRTIVKT